MRIFPDLLKRLGGAVVLAVVAVIFVFDRDLDAIVSRTAQASTGSDLGYQP